jgi:hypothetical protein
MPMYDTVAPSLGDELGDSLRKFNQALVAHFEFDPDAAAFFSAAGITNGTQKSAVNELVLTLKDESLWTLMHALYPYVGGSASPHSYNLKNPADFQITWSGSITHDSNGVTGDGSTGYGDTGLSPLAELDQESCGLTVYLRTATSATFTDDIGSNENSGTAEFDIRQQLTNMQVRMCGNDTAFTDADVIAAGCYIASRTSSTLCKIFHNGVEGGSNTGSDAGNTLSSGNIFVLATGVSGTASAFSPRNQALAAVHAGLSDAQALAFYTAIQAFQTALGRAV